jgi:hypothetical protein
VLWIYARLFITCLRSRFALSIYLTLVIMGIGHDLVRVHLCSNKDRLLSCLRHPFSSVTFPFISSRMTFSLLTGLSIAMCHPVWLYSRKYGTVWYHPASSKLWYLTALSFVNFQEKIDWHVL